MADIKKIATLMLSQINDRIKNLGIDLTFTDEVVTHLAKEGFDPVYGARPLKRYIQKHVETLAARLILSDMVHENDVIRIDVKDEQLVAAVEKQE